MLTHDVYCARAADRVRRPELWRTLAGLALVTALTLAGSTLLLVGAELLSRGGLGLTSGPGLATPFAIVVYLATFVTVHLALWAAARVASRQPLAAFLTVTGRLPWREAALGVGVVAALFAAGFLVSLPLMPPEPGLAPGRWALWLLPALAALAIQVSAEEALFRGYLQTALAARFRSAWIWLAAPSALFGVLHWSPAMYPGNAGLVVVSAALMGAIAADVTARTGSIAAATGLHFANNAIGILLVATPGALDGMALYTLPVDRGDAGLMRLLILGNIATLAVGYTLWRLWLQRSAALHSAPPAPK